MKTIFKLYFLFISFTNLESQTWDFFYKSEFNNSDKNNVASDFSIKGDSVIIIRRSNDYNIENDTFFIIYNQKNMSWQYYTKNDLRNDINDTALVNNIEAIYCLNFCNDNSIWQLVRINDKDKILHINGNSFSMYDKVYNRMLKDSFDFSGINERIYDLKVSKNNEVWAIIVHYTYLGQHEPYYSLSKFINGRFETIDYPDAPSKYVNTNCIAFDYNGRILHTNADTLYIIENEEVIRKICIQEFPGGIGYYMKMAVSKKNKVYSLSNIKALHIIDDKKMITDTFVQYQERLLQPNIDLATGYQMCIDNADNLWICGPLTCSLYRLDTSGKWTIYPFIKPDIIPKKDTCDKQFMEADEEGKIWITGYYGLYMFDPNGTSPVEEPPTMTESGALPDVWLYNLYPNPADGSTTIEFFLARAQKQKLNASVCSILGERTLNITPLLEYDDYNQRGKITFSTDGLAGGAYFVLVSAGDTKKLTLLMVAK